MAWIAGLALLGLIIAVGGTEILQAITAASLLPLIIGLALSTTLYPIAAWRWMLVTNQLEQRRVASYQEFLQVRSLAAAGGFFAPRELVELGGRTIWLSRSRGLSIGRATKAVMVDRFCDVLTSVVTLIGALAFWFMKLPVILSFSIGLACLVITIVITPTVMMTASGFIQRLDSRMNLPDQRSKRIGKAVSMLAKLIDIPSEIWRIALSISLLKFTMVALRVVLLGAAVGLVIEPLELVVSVPLGQIGYVLGITPGGLGIYEAGWYGLLHFLGASAAKIGAFVILLRLSLIASVLFVLPFVFGWRRTHPTAAS